MILNLAMLVAGCGLPGASPSNLRDAAFPARHLFVENRGQWRVSARYVASTPDGDIGIESRAFWFTAFDSNSESRSGILMRMEFEGSSDSVQLAEEDPAPGRLNYFRGEDPSRWVRGVRSFGGVRYQDLYPGTDLSIRSTETGMKYDVMLSAGADIARVRIRCLGATHLSVDGSGRLAFQVAGRSIQQDVGDSWQVLPDGSRRSLAVSFRVLGPDAFGFQASGLDAGLPTYIDPIFRWASYLGSSGPTGTGDVGTKLAFDSAGAVVATGYTDWHDFPTTPGAFAIQGLQQKAVFVSKLSPSGAHLIYSCILGGQGESRGIGLAIDALDRPTVCGWTAASDFPVTAGAFDTVRHSTSFSGFVFRLKEDGSDLDYSTYLEGTIGAAQPFAVATAANGSAVVGGHVTQSDFPTTSGAFQPNVTPNSSAFVSRLSPDGSSLTWSTYLGGNFPESVFALALDDQEHVTVTGRTQSIDFPVTPGAYQTNYFGGIGEANAFVTRLNSTGSALVWSTFLCGSGGDDWGQAITVDRKGRAIVAGSTASFDFPATAGSYQPRFLEDPAFPFKRGFLLCLEASGASLRYGTFLGSQGQVACEGVDVDASGIITVCGFGAGLFPTTPGAYLASPSQNGDGFVARFSPSASKLYYSSLIGGPGIDETGGLDVSSTGRVCLTGISTGGFPVTVGAYDTAYNGGQTDVVVTCMDLYLRGVEWLGSSTLACYGPLVANATRKPVAGDAGFGLYCSQAPEQATGWLLVGTPATQSFPYSGTTLWLDPTGGISRIPVSADEDGFVERGFSLVPYPPGSTVACQFLFRTTPSCPGQGAFAASNAIVIRPQ